jgi:methionyl-tRNA synthetase
MCMAAGIEPPGHFIVNGFLLVGGEKMSKTRLNQIDPVELAGDVGVDALRYHLLRDVALGSDGEFSAEGLTARYNADLANNLGNLVSRVATVVASKCEGIGPAPLPASEDNRIAVCAAEAVAKSVKAWEAMAPHEALEAAMLLVHETNHELEVNEPWKLPPGPEVGAVLGNALEAIRLVAVLVSPAMPSIAAEIWSRIGLPGRVDEPGRAGPGGDLAWGGYTGGVPVTKGEPLFPRRRAEQRLAEASPDAGPNGTDLGGAGPEGAAQALAGPRADLPGT